jgi:ubiquinone/menaquinone biosynthesis C-methylase UbiE
MEPAVADTSNDQDASAALKSKVKGHWEQETCGTRYGAETDRLEWFRTIASKRYELEPYIPAFAQFASSQGLKVLEIGVGAGSDFLQWCKAGAQPVGVDLTEAAIALTSERLGLEGVAPDAYGLRTADAENLPFEDNSFDVVYSWGVLHHTPNTGRAYSEVCRVLKPGGVMRTMIYQRDAWTNLMLYLVHGLAKGRIGLGLKGAAFEQLESPGTKVYTLAEAEALARAAGFTQIETDTRLGPGDLLTSAPSSKYQGSIWKLAYLLYPRPLVRLLGHRFGLYLLLSGTKPA